MDNKKDTQSAWDATAPETPNFSTLQDKIEVDIAIIGAGITGLTTAFELSKKGKKIAVLEAYKIGRGTTGYSTGNLYVPVQPFYQNILKKFNLRTVADIVRSRNAAINYIEGTVLDNNIDCHFARRPWYVYTNLDKNVSFLEEEVDTLKKVGVEINYTKDLDLPLCYKKAAVIQNQARFHPLKYVLGLASLLKETQCQIYENTAVISVEEENNRCVVTTESGKVYAKKVLMATHVPKGILPIQLFEAPYRSYVIAAKLRNNDYPKGNYLDLDEPGYVTSSHRLFDSSDELDILMVAGSHHKTGQPCLNKNYGKIMNYVKKHYDIESVEYMWSAQHYQAADDVPFIGLAHKHSNNIYLATGYFADGLTYGTVAGLLLTDLMTDTKTELTEIFNVHRPTYIASANKFIKENGNVFFQYAKDLPFNVDATELKNIKKGEGKTIQIESEKYAAYRDESGQLHVVSAVCTHMKCIVQWNKQETTWDCPCHGSRFDINGKVLEGPAYSDLKKMSNIKD